MLLMGQIKSSLAPAGPVLGFERQEKGPLNFLGEQQIDLQRLIDSTPRMKPRDRASAFLQEFLADGRHLAGEVISQAKALDITEGTLNRAAKELGVQRSRQGNLFFLQLPGDGVPARASHSAD